MCYIGWQLHLVTSTRILPCWSKSKEKKKLKTETKEKTSWPFEGLWGHHSHCSTSGPQGPAYRYPRPWPLWARPGTTASRSRRQPAPAASGSHSAAPASSPSTFAASLAPIRAVQPQVFLFPGSRLGFAIWFLRVSALGICPVTQFWRNLGVWSPKEVIFPYNKQRERDRQKQGVKTKRIQYWRGGGKVCRD